MRCALRIPFPKLLAILTITRALNAGYEAIGRRNMSQREIWSKAGFVPAGKFHRAAPAPASHQICPGLAAPGYDLCYVPFPDIDVRIIALQPVPGRRVARDPKLSW
ncbi:MAG: hypothetical protein CO149_03885 [Nitrospirae bacterium CG_4_9_14_3_um_filter_51_5]|nr:MAG: hypothetical protein CO149_03885 [Nitrospirae bacterium CG_4_9_14_3_um_filter_51_5]